MQNDMRDRLISLLNVAVGDSNLNDNEVKIIAEYLLDNGVIVPPCNIGDVVYSIRTDTKVIYSCSVCEFIINKHFENIHKECKVYIIEDGRFTYFDFSSFGKTVFFTKEEAEQKLKEMRVENAEK